MKTKDLTAGPLLDALVAMSYPEEDSEIAVVAGVRSAGIPPQSYHGCDRFEPSTNGGQAYELMAENDMYISSDEDVKIASMTPHMNGVIQEGATHAEAICKAKVAAKWGDEIPDDVIERIGL
jgi:hypothetical protein